MFYQTKILRVLFKSGIVIFALEGHLKLRLQSLSDQSQTL